MLYRSPQTFEKADEVVYGRIVSNIEDTKSSTNTFGERLLDIVKENNTVNITYKSLKNSLKNLKLTGVLRDPDYPTGYLQVQDSQSWGCPTAQDVYAIFATFTGDHGVVHHAMFYDSGALECVGNTLGALKVVFYKDTEKIEEMKQQSPESKCKKAVDAFCAYVKKK